MKYNTYLIKITLLFKYNLNDIRKTTNDESLKNIYNIQRYVKFDIYILSKGRLTFLG